jgi:hypothetical protein
MKQISVYAGIETCSRKRKLSFDMAYVSLFMHRKASNVTFIIMKFDKFKSISGGDIDF